jgi:hypothetical protein
MSAPAPALPWGASQRAGAAHRPSLPPLLPIAHHGCVGSRFCYDSRSAHTTASLPCRRLSPPRGCRFPYDGRDASPSLPPRCCSSPRSWPSLRSRRPQSPNHCLAPPPLIVSSAAVASAATATTPSLLLPPLSPFARRGSRSRHSRHDNCDVVAAIAPLSSCLSRPALPLLSLRQPRHRLRAAVTPSHSAIAVWHVKQSGS